MDPYGFTLIPVHYRIIVYLYVRAIRIEKTMKRVETVIMLKLISNVYPFLLQLAKDYQILQQLLFMVSLFF